MSGDRNRDYGHPDDNHGCTAELWNAWLLRRASPFGAVDVCVFNILQKLSRLAETPDHLDSWRDIAGYAQNAAWCLEQR